MEDAVSLYNQDKLLVRAMDWPQISRGSEGLQYDCTSWANEFDMMMNKTLSSASSTLIVPGVGVSTYKNIGFLINSDKADCFHIATSDSGSSGNLENGDFHANKADFATISELANYIKENNSTDLNEVNINTNIDSVVGLFINECPLQERLLQMIYVAKKCIESMSGIDYPVYLYNSSEGKLKQMQISHEKEEEIIASLRTTQLFYWPDTYTEPVTEDLNMIKSHIM